MNQRNLLDRGRDDARRIGAAVRAIGIPVGRVLASPVCRTMETARLVFGRAEAFNDVRGGPASAESATRYAPLRDLLSRDPAPGTNVAIVSHGNPFFAVAGTPYLAEGEAAVVRPLGSDFEVIGRVKLDDWAALVRAAGAR